MMTKHNKVAIIGAGIAGLSCATALENAGFQVTIFEKSRGVSGRLSTRVTADWQCDHGAQYFTAREPAFNAEVQRWVDANVAQLWHPSLKVFDGSTFSEKENATTSKTMRYVGYPANNSPAKWLAEKLNVLTEATVIHLQKNAKQWQVLTKEHGVHAENFDYVILCIPAPQAALLLINTQSNLAHLCAAVTMRPCFALMLQFQHRIHCQFDGLFINSGLLSWVARDSAKPGRDQHTNGNTETWILHASSEWSSAHVDDDKALLSQQMLAEFMKILQLDNAFNVNEQAVITPKSFVLHRWLYADCASCLADVYQFDAEHQIGLCGDWLNGGKVQGAWLSGLQLAHQLIHYASNIGTKT